MAKMAHFTLKKDKQYFNKVDKIICDPYVKIMQVGNAMGENCDLSDIDYSMVVGARWAGLSISKTGDLLKGNNKDTCI